RCDAQVDEATIAERKKEGIPAVPESGTPWQELYREHTGQLSTGGVLEFAVKYQNLASKLPRHNH
ncbi:MAG: dihydroxy-acid dehydratase, partial [Caulobacter sp.]|nr:dihydroxy-acid dehydratase [Caulobacter sp.]